MRNEWSIKTCGLLGSLDPNAPRQSLKDAVPYSAKRLESMTRSWLSLSPEFKPQTVSPCFKEKFPCTCTGKPVTGVSLFLSPGWNKHKHWATVTPAAKQRIAA